MSIQGEQELRHRLNGLLNDLEPGPAPVASTVRHGRSIRRRRLAGVAASLAVIVAAAALLPGLLRPASHVSPTVPLRYKVTVQRPESGWASGVIAEGVTNGRPWKFVASGPPSDPYLSVEGRVGMSTWESQPVGGSPASLLSENGSGHPGFAEVFGTVTHKVTRIVVDLPGGKAVTLTPVAWKGRRWVGLILPRGLPVVRTTAYSGDTELGYAVPFEQTSLNVWWRPGQAGPTRVTKVVGSGVLAGIAWKVTAEIGPWGYCYVYQGGSVCSDRAASPEVVPTSKLIAYMSCGPIKNSKGPYLGIAAARASVHKVVLTYSNGSSASFQAVPVSGGRVLAYVIPKNVSVTSSNEYGAAGQIVGSTSGAAWRPC